MSCTEPSCQSGHRGIKRHPRARDGASWEGLSIGLLGGSFNPAHEGHLGISLFAMKALDLDRVWWLVSPQNPIKPLQGMAPLATRLCEAQHMVRAQPNIVATDIEREMGTKYTVDTLKQLKKRFPRARFVWLMGADNMRQIPLWRQWPAIFGQVPLAILRRPGYVVGHNLGKAAQRFASASIPARQGRLLALQNPPRWTVLDNRLNPQSSTRIREKAQDSMRQSIIPVIE
ncbi:MAG: nicotinate-nucleotide adenylyltransferase [Bdellovibrionales bacterium]